MVALLFKAFGEHIAVARSLNLVFFIGAAVCLFDLGRRMFDVPTALLAVFFLSFNPLAAFFTHSLQPDTLMLLMTICAVNFFWRWSESGSTLELAASALALSAVVLIKPLNLYLGLPLIYLSYQKFGLRLFMMPQLWIFAATALIPAVLWYQHAYQLWVEHGNSLFRPYAHPGRAALWGKEFPLKIISFNDRSYLSELIGRAIHLLTALGGVLPLAVGALRAIKERNGLLICWAAGFLLTMVVFAEQHGGHDYYQLPLVLVVSLLVADGIASLWTGRYSVRVLAAALGVIYVLAELWLHRLPFREVGNQSLVWIIFLGAGFFYLTAFAVVRRPHTSIFAGGLLLIATYGTWRTLSMEQQAPWIEARQAFGSTLQQLTPSDARIVVPDHHSRQGWFQHRTAEGEYLGYMPTDFYLSRRHGWSITFEQALPRFLETLRERGAAHFAAWCCTWGQQPVSEQVPALAAYLACAHTPLHVTDRILIYRLTVPRRRPDGSSCLPD
jgi:4-amino-4-deoxy-L-arabinose transferase-like glycosyltransferase